MGNLNLAWLGGKFESEVSSLSSENTIVFILNMQVFKGKEVTFTRKIVRRWFRLLQKNWPSTPAFQVGHLNTISAPWGGNFNKPIYKIKRAGGSPSEDAEASKWSTSPSSFTVGLQFPLNLAHTRKFLWINWKVYMNTLSRQMSISDIHATKVFPIEILLHDIFAIYWLTQKEIIRCINKETQ